MQCLKLLAMLESLIPSSVNCDLHAAQPVIMLVLVFSTAFAQRFKTFLQVFNVWLNVCQTLSLHEIESNCFLLYLPK